MARLRFYARDAQLVAVPNQIPLVGTARQYVGRDFRPAANGKPAGYPATKEPQAFNSDTPAGQLLIDEVRRSRRQGSQSLWCADEATAAACEVPFVAVAFEGGQWRQTATAQPSTDDAGNDKPGRSRKSAGRK